MSDAEFCASIVSALAIANRSVLEIKAPLRQSAPPVALMSRVASTPSDKPWNHPFAKQRRRKFKPSRRK